MVELLVLSYHNLNVFQKCYKHLSKISLISKNLFLKAFIGAKLLTLNSYLKTKGYLEVVESYVSKILLHSNKGCGLSSLSKSAMLALKSLI